MPDFPFQNLRGDIPIVNEDGTPTDYFLQMMFRMKENAEEDSGDIGTKLSKTALLNTGTGLQGGGELGAPLTLALDADLDDLNDVDLVTTPPDDGQALVWDDASNLWVPGDVGGGGAASVEEFSYVAAMLEFTNPAVPVVVDSLNASITRTAAGRFRLTFTTPFVDTNYSVIGTGRYNDAAGDTVPVFNVDRRVGQGRTTTYVDVTIMPSDGGAASDNFLFARITILRRKKLTGVGSGLIGEVIALGGEFSLSVPIPVGYKRLRFDLVGRGTQNNVSIRLNNDVTAIYDNARVFHSNTGASGFDGNSSQTGTRPTVTANGGTAPAVCFLTGDILNPSDVQEKQIAWRGKQLINAAGSQYYLMTGTSAWRSNALVNAVAAICESTVGVAGTWTAGTIFRVWGTT